MSYKKVPSIKHQQKQQALAEMRRERVIQINDFFNSMDPRARALWEETMTKIYGPEVPEFERVKLFKNLSQDEEV